MASRKETKPAAIRYAVARRTKPREAMHTPPRIATTKMLAWGYVNAKYGCDQGKNRATGANEDDSFTFLSTTVVTAPPIPSPRATTKLRQRIATHVWTASRRAEARV